MGRIGNEISHVNVVLLENFAAFDKGLGTHTTAHSLWNKGSTETIVNHADKFCRSEAKLLNKNLVLARKFDARNSGIISAWNTADTLVKVGVDWMIGNFVDSFGVVVGGDTAFEGDSAINALLENFGILTSAGAVADTLGTTVDGLFD